MKTFIVDSIIIVGLFGFSNEKEVLVKEDDSKTIYAYVENVEALNESSHLINAYVEDASPHLINAYVEDGSSHLINAYVEGVGNTENTENTEEKPLEDYQFVLPKYIFEL